jgi:hypothetical protein
MDLTFVRRLITIEGLPVENAPCAHINRPLYPIQTLQIDLQTIQYNILVSKAHKAAYANASL